jgi:glycosyltransferase involved in cell wall biosynthesis
MKLAYVTIRSPSDINDWSGTTHYITQCLQSQSITLEYIGPLKNKFYWGLVRKFKYNYYDFTNKKYLKNPEPLFLKDYASQVSNKLSKSETDVVFSVTPNPIAYLECKQPIVYWADATFAGLKDFYPHYSNLCDETVTNWHLMETLALQKAKLAIYSSEWAAKTAIEFYNADPDKVKVVPFGANIDSKKTFVQIKDSIESKSTDKCKLLFIGVDWNRKGGNVAYQVAKMLNQSGQDTELTVVGCQPELEEPLPSFVKPLGFISKSNKRGKEKISQLISESHFLIVPSKAECYGIVFCEANSLGVPCLATKVGGIPTIIKDDINGKLFNIDADPEEYCSYILNLFINYCEYKKLAFSSFREYQLRLNWTAAGQNVKKLLTDIY